MSIQFEGNIAVIGFGVMGETLVKSLLDKGLPGNSIAVSDTNPNRLKQAEELGVIVALGNRAAVRGAGMILLCVKPQSMPEVLEEIAGVVVETQVVVSIAAGITTCLIEKWMEYPVPVVRVMPNLPSVVNEGVIAMAAGQHADHGCIQSARSLFEISGRVFMVDESMMDAVTGFTGSGPAFIAVVIEALSDAGVLVGFTRADAVAMAAQTILGSARLVLETGIHPALLKDRVASPGGTAITGLHQLEQFGIRSAIMSAVLTATGRASELGQSQDRVSTRVQP